MRDEPFSSMQSQPRILSDFDWDCEAFISEFERSLRSDQPIDVALRLQSFTLAQQHMLIAEIACIDLEYLFELGQRPEISPYLSDFSDYFAQDKLRDEVGREHYRLSRRYGQPVSPSEIAMRYGVDGAKWSEMPLGEISNEADLYPKVGQEFCGFPLLAELGQGALARVYLARQPDLAERLVVLKVSRQATGEANELARLQHSGIIPVYGIHRQDGLFAICMPYLGAMTLGHLMSDPRVFDHSTLVHHRQLLASTLVSARLSTIASSVSHTSASEDDNTNFHNVTTPVVEADRSDKSLPAGENRVDSLELSQATASSADSLPKMLGLEELASSLLNCVLCRPALEAKIDIMLGVVTALAHAHSRGIIHRDLKPDNVLIANDGRPVLLDFNLAVSQQAVAEITGGTIPYMSAQQLQTLRDSDSPWTASPTDDVFSIGAILYQLLVGRFPFPSRMEVDLSRQIELRRQLPESPAAVNPQVPPSLNSIVTKCLAYEQGDRYPSAVELLEDLNRFQQHQILKYAPDRSLPEHVQRWVRRHPTLTSTGTLSVVMLIVLSVLGGLLWNSHRSSKLLAADRQMQRILAGIAEPLAQLRSPGLEPELLHRGIASGEKLLRESGLVLDGPSLGQPLTEWSLLRELSSDQWQQLSGPIGQLLFEMSGAQAELAAVSQPMDASALKAALRWNSLAVQYSSQLAQPASMQLERIQKLTPDAFLSQYQINQPATAADDLYAQMLVAKANGDVQHWQQLADELVRRLPTDPARWITLGSAQLQAGQPQAAEDAFDVAAKLQPDSLTAIFWRGVVRLRNAKYGRAVEDFTACIDGQTDWEAPRYNRALANQSLGAVDQALSDLNHIVTNGHASPKVFVLRSQLLRSSGRNAEADQDLRQAMAATPISADDWVTVGTLKIGSHPQQSLTDFQRAIAIDPTNYAAHFNSAHVYSEVLGDVQSAVKELSALVDAGNSTASILASRGILLARQGQTQLALADALSAANSNPGALEMLQIAGIYSLIAENDAALQQSAAWMARSIAAGPEMKAIGLSDPDTAKLRESPTFEPQVKLMLTNSGSAE